MALTRAHGRGDPAGDRSRLSWYASRAMRMNVPEVKHRVLRVLGDAHVFARLKWTGQAISCDPAPITILRSSRDCLPDIEWDMDGLQRDQHALLEGRVAYGGFDWRWHETDDVWRRAPDTGLCWPQTFSPFMSFRAGNRIGDARIIWEPNRLQQLVGLALLTRSHDGVMAQRARRQLRSQLRSWVRLNPPMVGVNYTSAMDCAQRMLSVIYAAHVARDALAQDEHFWGDVTTLVHSHSAIVAGKLSLHSSLGNHTVAESVALFTACLVAPGPHAAAWESQALEALAQACNRVFLKDGASAEQSTAYHVLVLDLLHLAIGTGARHGRDMGAFVQLHNAGSAFLRSLACNGRLPHIGDSDSSHSLSRYMAPSWRLGLEGDSREVLTTWREGGYSVMRMPRAFAIFDHGPLGMPPNYAHGHADALSLLLELDGAPLLIDPGTGWYADTEGWRGYFRGTSAHNTVSVGGEDQACAAGPFLWSRPPAAHLDRATRSGERIFLLGHHDGYLRFGLIHRRGLLLSRGRMVVIDKLEPHGSSRPAARCALRWHFEGQLDELHTGWFRHHPTGATVSVSAGQCSVTRGSLEPRGGWLSVHYGEIAPATTLECVGFGACEFMTIFEFPWAQNSEPELRESDLSELQDYMSADPGLTRRRT